MEQFLNMWYIDVEETDSLWNQISNNVVEITKSQNTEKSFYSKLQAKLSGLKLVGAAGETGINYVSNLSVEEKIEPSIEWKIRRIIEEIGGNSIYLRDALGTESGTKLVFVQGFFGLKELYCKTEPEKNIMSHYKMIENAKDLVWHFEFLSNSFDVSMYADGAKIRMAIRHMTNKIEYMHPFPFKILGWLEYTGANSYSIKPIVILR